MINAIRDSKREAEKAAAIQRLEYWREKGKEERAKDYSNKWDTMSDDKWNSLYQHARCVSTRDLMIMVLTNKGGIKPEFRHSPWSAALITRMDSMTDSELDEAGLRATKVQIADELIKR